MYYCTRPCEAFTNPCWRASSDKFHRQRQEFGLPKSRRVSRLTATVRTATRYTALHRGLYVSDVDWAAPIDHWRTPALCSAPNS